MKKRLQHYITCFYLNFMKNLKRKFTVKRNNQVFYKVLIWIIYKSFNKINIKQYKLKINRKRTLEVNNNKKEIKKMKKKKKLLI